MKRIILGTLFILLTLALLSFGSTHPGINTDFSVVDERGNGIQGAVIKSSYDSFVTDNSGNAKVKLKKEGPDTLLISADGYLSEAVPVGWDNNNQKIEIKLLDDKDKRVVINFGGDVMLGRRYVEPLNVTSSSLEPVIKVGSNDIARYISTAFSNADLSCINFESTIGDLDISEKLAGKRFFLQSPPESIAELQGMGVDLVSLANNHIRDWGNKGVENTSRTIEEAGMVTVGAGNEKTSREPAIVNRKNVKIGTLSYTSVNGSYVNMFFPTNKEQKPDGVTKDEYWIWEKRTWSYSSDEWEMPEGKYRIGEVWRAFSNAKDTLSIDQQTKIWNSMTGIYPELQNWIAKYDDSGAAGWDAARSIPEIKALKQKVDLVIVQLHSGFQFKTSPSDLVINEAHEAIDAGADIVIAHHPHVLQGMEWYKGHLIVYSLGNFVFDQEFFETLSSGFLRTVWDGNQLVEARFMPFEIVDYVPIPVTGISAKQIINQVWESSSLPAKTKRKNNFVYTIAASKDSNSKPVEFCYEWGTARLTQNDTKEKYSIALDKDQIIKLSDDFLWPARLGLNYKASNGAILIGRDLFRWGHFEDTLADIKQLGAAHIELKQHGEWIIDKQQGKKSYIELSNSSDNELNAMIRTESRIPVVEHRIYNRDYSPLDPDAKYSIRMRVKGKGDVNANLRVDSYWFYDRNPIEDPYSVLLGKKEYLITTENQWKTIDIPIDLIKVGDKETNSIMVYIELTPPDKNKSILSIDDFEIIEWREAGAMPNYYGAYSYIKNNGDPVNLSFEVLSSVK